MSKPSVNFNKARGAAAPNCLHGSGNHGNHNGFTALGKTIGTSKSTETDADYVTEHQALNLTEVPQE
jgi:hypothetical protein